MKGEDIMFGILAILDLYSMLFFSNKVEAKTDKIITEALKNPAEADRSKVRHAIHVMDTWMGSIAILLFLELADALDHKGSVSYAIYAIICIIALVVTAYSTRTFYKISCAREEAILTQIKE